MLLHVLFIYYILVISYKQIIYYLANRYSADWDSPVGKIAELLYKSNSFRDLL